MAAAPGRSITTRKDVEILHARTESESLPALLTRLGDDVMRLTQSQLSLLKLELKQEVKQYVAGSLMIAAGGLIALVGFALANVALAFGVSTFFAQTNLSEPAQFALGFVITGVFYLIVGGIVVLAMKNRLAKVDLVPDRTVEELRKDKQWLKNEL